MRHELLLVLLVVTLLITEISLPQGKKAKGIPIAIGLFGIITILGFLPAESGSIFGGMYHTDELRIVMKNVLNLGVLVIFLQSWKWLEKSRDMENRAIEFIILIVSTLIGMNYMISSGDFLMFYLGLELATIPIAALAAYERYKKKSAEAGIKMVINSAFSSGIMLFGISLIYGSTGSLYFAEIMPEISGNSLQIMAFIFFFAGMGFKISLAPFHLWTADVYEGAPISVTAYLSVISKGSATFVLLIILYTVFREMEETWKDILYIVSILTMTIGNLFAIRQKNLKRFLAFSSIAQAGFILLGIINGGSLGLATVLYFILIYIFSNLAAFGVISAISRFSGKENRDDYKGLYRTNPMLSLVLTLALFSLAGIPPVAGFFGKFFLFTAAAQSGYYILVLIAVLNATIGLYYYLLVVKAMFIEKNETPIEKFKSDLPMQISLVICVICIIAIGFISPIFEYMANLTL